MTLKTFAWFYRHRKRPGQSLRRHVCPSSPWWKSGCIRRAMHPRRLRCSSLKYSRYSRSSRLAGGAPRPSRCDARLSPRAARGQRFLGSSTRDRRL